jgi:hypothetical protein
VLEVGDGKLNVGVCDGGTEKALVWLVVGEGVSMSGSGDMVGPRSFPLTEGVRVGCLA